MQDLPRDEASLTAMRFIELFNQALEREGIKTHIGFEQEFDLKYNREQVAETVNQLEKAKHPGAEDKVKTLDPKDVTDADLTGIVHAIRAQVPDATIKALKLPEDTAQIKSGPMRRFYKEAQAGMFEMTYTPSSPLRAAHRVAAMRRFIESHQNAPADSAKSRFGITHVSFAPYKNVKVDEHLIYDLHGNMSFTMQSPDQEHPLYLMYDGESKPHDQASISTHLSDTLKQLATSDLALVADSRASYQRLAQFGSDRPHTKIKMNKLEIVRKGDETAEIKDTAIESSRVEFRLPDARSNPYFATLFMMAAAYETLHKAPEKDWRGEGWSAAKPEGLNAPLSVSSRPAYPAMPASLDEAAKRFNKKSKVVELMREVARDVGTEKDVADVDKFKTLMAQHLKQQSRQPIAFS